MNGSTGTMVDPNDSQRAMTIRCGTRTCLVGACRLGTTTSQASCKNLVHMLTRRTAALIVLSAEERQGGRQRSELLDFAFAVVFDKFRK